MDQTKEKSACAWLLRLTDDHSRNSFCTGLGLRVDNGLTGTCVEHGLRRCPECGPRLHLQVPSSPMLSYPEGRPRLIQLAA